MKAQILATTAIAAILAGCTTAYGHEMETTAEVAQAEVSIPTGTGYFAADSTLPFLTPDFTKIKENDYIPAFEQGMAIQKAEVEAITNNPAEPTFENTIVALETRTKVCRETFQQGRAARPGYQGSLVRRRPLRRRWWLSGERECPLQVPTHMDGRGSQGCWSADQYRDVQSLDQGS